VEGLVFGEGGKGYPGENLSIVVPTITNISNMSLFLFSHADACGESETQCSKDAECKTPNECCVCNSGYHGNGKMCLKNGM
jgi:hypothetical protein